MWFKGSWIESWIRLDGDSRPEKKEAVGDRSLRKAGARSRDRNIPFALKIQLLEMAADWLICPYFRCRSSVSGNNLLNVIQSPLYIYIYYIATLNIITCITLRQMHVKPSWTGSMHLGKVTWLVSMTYRQVLNIRWLHRLVPRKVLLVGTSARTIFFTTIIYLLSHILTCI